MNSWQQRLSFCAIAIFSFWSSVSIAAAEPEEQQVAAPFAVEVSGSGKPMMLVPGLTCGGNVWDETVEHFQDHYQCHVFTLAGFAGQPPIDEPFLPTMRDELIAYIKNKNLDRPVIIGHSLGATLAFAIAAEAPDAVGPIVAVDGVPCMSVLMDPTATPENVKPVAEALRAQLQAATPKQFAQQNRLLMAGMVIDPQDLEKIAEESTKSDPKTAGQAMYELLLLDLREEVKAIQSPVLLLGSTALLPTEEEKKQAETRYREQVSAIAQHKVVFAPKARHFIQLDEPEFFFREVETFLEEQARRDPRAQ